MKKLIGFLLLSVLLLGQTITLNAEEKATVMVGALCPLNTIMEDAKKLTKTKNVVPGEGCIGVRMIEVPILEVVSEAFKDTDGDVFYVVQVSKDPDLYTIAWPGHNSTLKKTTGI